MNFSPAAYPDVEVHELDEGWEFALLASDGIWDVLSNDDVVRMCLRKIAAGTPPEQICEELMTECLSPDLLMTGTDNMTVVLICFLHNKSYDELSARAAEYAKNFEESDAKSTKAVNVDEAIHSASNGQVSPDDDEAAAADKDGTANGSGSRTGGDNESSTTAISDSNNVASEAASNGQSDEKLATQTENGEAKNVQESKKFKETESTDDLK